jgi:hypothetical protein
VSLQVEEAPSKLQLMPEGPKLCSVVTIICPYDTIISLISFIMDIITKQEFAIRPGIH